MKKQAFLLTIAILPFLTGCQAKTEQAFSRNVFAMDTYMTLKIWSQDGEKILDDAETKISDLESEFSVTMENSDVYHINHAEGKPVPISEDTATVIQKAIQIGNESQGALDITLYPVTYAWGFTTDTMQIPDNTTLKNLLSFVDYTKIQCENQSVTLPENMQLDLGAVAKGYTSDTLIELLKENHVTSAILSLGGNVQALGKKPDGSFWTVGIVNPFTPQENLCTIQIEDKAVITSGNYERFFTAEDGKNYWHILDKADGYPADNGLVSVTIIGESGLDCDALSTALFVEGTEKAIAHWNSRKDFEMILVTDTEKILYTDGLQPENLSNLPMEVISRESTS